MCHLPEPDRRTRESRGGKCCILCRWATGRKLSAGLLYCSGCDVNLCDQRYKSYHSTPVFDDAFKNKIKQRLDQKPKRKVGKGKKK